VFTITKLCVHSQEGMCSQSGNCVSSQSGSCVFTGRCAFTVRKVCIHSQESVCSQLLMCVHSKECLCSQSGSCVFTVRKECVHRHVFSDNKMTLLLLVGKLPRYKLRETIRMLKTCFRICWHAPCKKPNQRAIFEVMLRRTLLTIFQTFRTFLVYYL